MRALAVLALVACHHAPPPRVATKPASIWPVPVRVMTWTPEGVVQVGVLPDAPPAVVPATPWYVEPTRALDAATFARLVTAVDHEHVPGLSLRGQPVAPWLDQLAKLRGVTALILDDTGVDGAVVERVPPGLRRLYLARAALDDAAVERLVASQPELEALGLEDCAIGDRAVRAIATLGALKAVDLAGTQLTDAGGAALGALAKLEILDLGRTRVAARTIVAIRPLALRELFLDQTRAGKEIATLAGYAPGIVRFDVSSLAAYKPSDADLAWLASAPNLVEVALTGAQVHDKLALQLAALPKLRELRLAQTAITRVAIAAIAKRMELEEVDLAETPVDDASAAALLALPKLRMLRLDRTPIGDAALAATPGPALVELYLSRTKVGDTAVTQLLAQLPRLVALGLGETQVADATVARVAQLRELHTLVLSATRASRETLDALGGLRQLERLYLEQTRTGDSTLAALAAARELRVLHVEGTDISEEALPVLHGFARLEELTIGDTRMRDAIVELAAWPRLRTLSLLGLPLGDAAIAKLARHRPLRALDLSSTEVTDPSPLAALPDLRVLGLAQTRLSRAGTAAAAALAKRGVEIVR